MNKKNNNKGFTLVELIVVLVILAILAAILVPALLGYIDRAKQQQIVLNARSCYTAAQAEMTSKYAKTSSDATGITLTADEKKRIMDTADVPADAKFTLGTAKMDTANILNHANFTVTYCYYKEGDSEVWMYDKNWVEEAPTSMTGYTTYEVK